MTIRLPKVATPATAATVVVLPLVKPLGPLFTTSAIFEVLEVTMLPNASSTATLMAGLSALPAVPLAGVWLKTSLLAAAAAIVMLPDVTAGNDQSVTLTV